MTGTLNIRSRGVQHARGLLVGIIADIEAKAAPSDFKDDILRRLRETMAHTWRNVIKTPSRRVSRRIDRDIVQSVMLAAIAQPNAARKEIGDQFGIQSGRVTEILQGKYDHLLSDELRASFGKAREDIAQLQLAFPKVRRAA